MDGRRANRNAASRVALVAGVGATLVLGVAMACGPGNIGDLTSGRLDSGASEAAVAADADVCVHAGPAERPDGGDGASIADLVFAADEIRIDTGDFDAGLPKPESIDLDRTCSCLEPPSCVAPADAGAPVCDGPDGRDNVSGPLLGTLALLLPALDPAFLTQRIRQGVYGILLSVQKWNGQPNDPDVVVSFRMSVGIQKDDDVDGGAPKFDGNDVWDIDPGSIVAGDTLVGQECSAIGCIGIGSDVAAYVRDGVLVARFDELPLTVSVGSGRLVLPFIGTVLMARITQDGAGYRIRGELAGRWRAADILAGSAAIRDPITNTSLCGNPETYGYFKRSVCSSVDLAGSPADDRTGAPCTALSEAVAFSARPAKLGKVRQLTQPPVDCPDFKDTCP
ncbi:MAG: hypothetical protein KF764_00550 [Labilithrix sp.]|nr:hypothetical protein [Labilithrix sp.]